MTFGGALLKFGTNPKIARPLDSKLPIHLVLRAEKSAMRLPAFFVRVDNIIKSVARRHGVRLYEFANAGNHLHLLLKLPRRAAWNAFIRDLTSQIARLTKVRWLNRPYTRVVRGWRKAFRLVKSYVQLNAFEVTHRATRREALTMRQIEKEMLASP